MAAWWNSSDALTAVFGWLRFAAFSFTALGAFTGGLTWLVGGRLDVLRAAKDLERQQRLEKAEAGLSEAGRVQAEQLAREEEMRAKLADAQKEQAMQAVKSEELREQLDEARGTVTSVEQRLRRRTIPSSEHALAITALRNNGPRGEVKIEAVFGDPEAFEFAEELKALLTEAGWPTGGAIDVVASADPIVGIVIRAPSAQTPHAAFLQQVLNRIGFPVSGKLAPNIPVGSATLIVGTKPRS